MDEYSRAHEHNAGSDAEITPAAAEGGEGSRASERKPRLTGPKRQHFLPQFYLDGFTNDGLLAIYDRENNEVRVQQPLNTGVIGHFYTFEDRDGRKRFELEEFLSEYETKASPVIQKLAARETIVGQEREALALFVALAAFRTPDTIDSLKAFHSELLTETVKRGFADVEEVKEHIRRAPDRPETEEGLEAEARELVEFVQGGEYEIETKHQWTVGKAIKMSFAIAPILIGRTWSVIHRDSERRSFVTTDAPVVLTTIAPRKNSFWGIGFGNADALVVFPLKQSCVLAMHGKGGDLQHLTSDSEHMRHTNLCIADHCQRFVIGRDEQLVRSLTEKLGLADKKWQRKMQRT